ncbi:MAG: matrixin family metalloprotease [Desulfobacterales bacterium]|nr:MAG: matrixin family metalloprotease [Desulfobacterales bacterium]
MKYLLFIIVILAILFSIPVGTYVLVGNKWPDARTLFNVDIPGASGLWDDAFEEAMFRWNDTTNFKFNIIKNSFGDPCGDPNVGGARNGVAFSDTICGLVWSGQTIAITIIWVNNNTNEMVQTGVLFNSDEDWDVYSGPWWRNPYFGINDFRRIAVHELGHCLGLGHEDSVAAIMQTRAGDIEYPTADDIAGVNFLYPASSDNSNGGGGGGGLCFISVISRK